MASAPQAGPQYAPVTTYPAYPAPGYAPGYAAAPGYGYPPANPPPAYPYGYAVQSPSAERPPLRKKSPAASRGFQLGLRVGLAIPTGLASGARGDALNERYASQFVFDTEIGAKATEALFIGGYLGFGVGAEGRDERIESFCDDDDGDSENDIECSVVSLRLGALARWSFSPAESVNPWVAYGIGYESQSQSINDRIAGRRETTRASGIEFARVSAGLDWRLGKTFGFGPLLEASLGSYSKTSTEVNGETTFDGDVEDSAVHTWVTLGMRGVFFP